MLGGDATSNMNFCIVGQCAAHDAYQRLALSNGHAIERFLHAGLPTRDALRAVRKVCQCMNYTPPNSIELG